MLTHEERQALIRKPFPCTYILPVKRWGGVQIQREDEDLAHRAELRRQKYRDAQERLTDRAENDE